MMKKKLFGIMTLIVAVMLAFGFVGCGDDGTGDGNNDDPNKVATPTASPAGGTYATAQTVTLSTTTSGASIRYTTDGNAPTSTSGTVFSGTISVTASTTIKAIAYKDGMTDSNILTATYTISGSGGGNIVLESGYAWVNISGYGLQNAYTFSSDNKWSQYQRINSTAAWSEISSGTYTLNGNTLNMGTASDYTISVTSTQLTFAGVTYTKTAFTAP
jgi:hypothetical protein